MAKRYSTQRVPREYNEFLNMYTAERNIKNPRVYEAMMRELDKTKMFLDELLGVRRR